MFCVCNWRNCCTDRLQRIARVAVIPTLPPLLYFQSISDIILKSIRHYQISPKGNIANYKNFMIAVMSTLQDKKVLKLPKFPIFEQYQQYQLKEILRYTWFTQMCYLGFEVLAKVLSHTTVSHFILVSPQRYNSVIEVLAKIPSHTLCPIFSWFHHQDLI